MDDTSEGFVAGRPVAWYLQQGVILFAISRLDEDADAQVVFDEIRTITDHERLKRILLLIAASTDWRAILAGLPGTAADEPIILEPPPG